MSTTLATLIATCAPLIHPTTLSALIHVESAANPYAVSLNRPARLEDAGYDPATLIPRQPTTAVEAANLTRQLLRQGITTSVGLAQINIEHLPHWRHRLSDLFDPCINLQLAQAILIDCDQTSMSATTPNATRIRRTLSCYNTGNTRDGITNGYVSRIHRVAAHSTPATALLAKR